MQRISGKCWKEAGGRSSRIVPGHCLIDGVVTEISIKDVSTFLNNNRTVRTLQNNGKKWEDVLMVTEAFEDRQRRGLVGDNGPHHLYNPLKCLLNALRGDYVSEESKIDDIPGLKVAITMAAIEIDNRVKDLRARLGMSTPASNNN